MWIVGAYHGHRFCVYGMKEGYEYTPSGQVSRTTDGNSVQYHYNSFGKVSERTDQLGYTEIFRYDEEGNLSLHIDRDSRRLQRDCNVFGKPVYEKATDAEGKNSNISTWHYDSLGRVISRHQQTKVETETGNVQENLYDVENLRFELLENGGRTSFVYHNGELLYEEGGYGNRTSYHFGAGLMRFKGGRDCLTTRETSSSVQHLLQAEMEKSRTAIFMMPLALS